MSWPNHLLEKWKLYPEVRFKAVSSSDADNILESITASDSSFYIAHIRLVTVTVEIESDTIPLKYSFQNLKKQLNVQASQEAQEIEMLNFVGVVKHKKLSSMMIIVFHLIGERAIIQSPKACLQSIMDMYFLI